MVPKKSNYWDQIFTNQSPEADDASQNEENAPNPTGESDTQEHDLNVREILFAEEGPDAAPMASLQKEFAQETADKPAESQEEETPENESQEEDPFFGWTQTTKVYSSLNFDDEEKPQAEEESEDEASDETDENSDEVLEEDADEFVTEETAEVAEEEAEIEAEEEAEQETEAEAEEEAANEPFLSEDGSLRITLTRYEHPAKGFGFGLLEDAEYPEEEAEEAAEETAEEALLDETPEETPAPEEPETPVAPAGLDSWGSLAFELGLPVTIPEPAPEPEAPKGLSKLKKEEKSSKTRRPEKETEKTDSKIVIDLEDEDFVSPENVYADSAKDVRPGRNAGPERSRREDRDKISDFGLKQVAIPEMDENVEEEPPRHRRRRGNASPEASAKEKRDAALSAIVAGVVESKTKDESGKSGRKSGKGRSERPEFQEEEAVPSRRERSRRSRRAPVEEIPQDDFLMADEEDFQPQAVQEDENEEIAIPNGARSRRRRRAQHEKMEQTKARAAAQVDEEDEEDETSEEIVYQTKKRSRRDGRNRFREELEDEKNEWMDVEEDSEDEEDEEEEAPRARRQRRSGRSGGKNQFQESRVSDEVFEDEEDHVFTEVDDEEDEDEDEWETDFSKHEVPSWHSTIDFIVNSNLKARKREPSSMVENISRMNKRGGKRK